MSPLGSTGCSTFGGMRARKATQEILVYIDHDRQDSLKLNPPEMTVAKSYVNCTEDTSMPHTIVGIPGIGEARFLLFGASRRRHHRPMR